MKNTDEKKPLLLTTQEAEAIKALISKYLEDQERKDYWETVAVNAAIPIFEPSPFCKGCDLCSSK